MDRVAQFGETWKLLLAEDRIVAKLAEPWPPGVSLPEGCKLENDSLITNQRSLVAASSVLCRKAKVSRALFAGCESFESSEQFRTAAARLLRGAEELCIVHNKNQAHALVRAFPNIRVLALPHDLCRHELGIHRHELVTADHSSPLMAQPSQLTHLLGNVESLGGVGLIFSKEAVAELLRMCPQLRRIDSHVVLEAFLLLDALPIPRTYSTANDFTHLALYAEVGGTCGETAPAGPDDVALAGSTFPLVEDLEVLTRSVEALDKIAAFQHVDTLLVALAPPVAWANVDSKLQQLLGNWPRLGKLALEYCGGVRLSTIAALCPKVRSLRLAYCKWDPSDCPVEAGAFPELESIELYIRMADAVFDSLFLATCGRLRKVQLYNDRSCCQFLHLCVRKRAHFPCLEELRLSTDISVRAMALEPESLHNVLRALPALRHLATDSYDLKLFFENYYVPRGRVFYSRDACVFCAVHGTNVPSRLQAASAVASNLIGHSGDFSCSIC
ncbi:hypothetical protein MRX96_031774 [Rhipicephalus microplus]|uniref:uncharacterized protein LOC142785977 n=1 Tax=Rhipicephalus microplus TaxID=6941 RepID=UPI003F6B79D9